MTEDGATENSLRPRPSIVVLVVAVCVAGIALRIAQYWHNRALWIDEAALALQVVYKSPGELIGPLSWHQNSPLGFLLAVKALVDQFGSSEYVLRLLPIVCGILSVPMFAATLWQSTRKIEQLNWEILISGLVLFAFGKHLIYYASELRHYSMDVLAVCVLIWLARWAFETEEFNQLRLGNLLVAGIIATWMLLASVFVLGGIAGAYCLSWAASRDWKRAGIAGVIGILWLGSFVAHLSIHSANIEARDLSPEIEARNAMSWAPFPPASYEDLRWYRESFDFMFQHPTGLTYVGLGGFAFLVGCFALWRRDRTAFYLFVLPIVFALVASALHRYPFRDRYILFLVPLVIALIAHGIGFIASKGDARMRMVAALLMFMLAFQPVLHSARVLVQPRGGYEIKPLLAHLQERWDANDGLYLPLHSVPQFMYYWPRIDFDAVTIPKNLYYGQTQTTFPGLAADNLVLEPDPAFLPEPGQVEAILEAWRETHYPRLLRERDSVWILYEHDSGPPIDTPVGAVNENGLLLEIIRSDGATLYRYTRPAD